MKYLKRMLWTIEHDPLTALPWIVVGYLVLVVLFGH